MAALPFNAQAQFTNVVDYFELDGNVAQNGTAKDDWTTINGGGSTYLNPALGSIVKRAFIIDLPGTTIFAGGGSKDDLDLSGPLSSAGGWKHKSGSVPDKDDITNAYATAYNIGGDLVVYAGADRIDNSGDAFMGFWFFKSAVSVNANGGFSGTHTPGDILVLANFQGGGTTVTIQVLEWMPGAPGAINGVLKLLAGDTVNNARCGTSVSPLYCGITNGVGGEDPPWNYVNKSGGTTFQPATFFEMGINISKVLLQAGESASACFSAFLAETRSSSSVSATLKDFALGGFDVCGVEVTKQCGGGTVVNGSSIDYTIEGKIINTGFGSLSNMVLTDTPQTATPPATVSSNFTYFNCATQAVLGGGSTTFAGPLAAGAEVCYRSSFNTTINGSTNSIKVVANTGATTTTQDTSELATCPILTFDTGITATKACTARLESNGSSLFVKVDVSGTVCNQGNLGLTGVSVTDIVAGLANATLPVVSASLGPKGSATECTTFSGTYIPVQADAGTTTQFSDAVTAQGTPPPITGQTVVATVGSVGATCNLCPTGQCITSDGTRLNSILRSTTTTRKK
jgi:hypothetical protein